MEFRINWKYVAEDRERVFTQVYEMERGAMKGVVKMPPFCAGMYISNAYNACKVDIPAEGYADSEAFREWKKIAGDTYFRLNEGEENRKYILFDSVSFPAFCIFKNVRAMLEETGSGNGNLRWSQNTADILREGFPDSFSFRDITGLPAFEERIQYCIDRYTEKYNSLLILSADGNFGADFYKLLCECLKKYGSSDFIKQYISANNERERCFATFIEDGTHKKYISFSGFIDAGNSKILKWLGRSELPIVTVLADICNQMSAKFVPINLQTRRYGLNNHKIVQGFSLDEVIDNDLRKLKKYYSCCERKIFGFFGDDTPDGGLYVKMKMCGECALGLLFQITQGKNIELHDGLSV